MKAEALAVVRKSIEGFAYSVDDEGRLHSAARGDTSVKLEVKRGRLVVSAPHGKLFSGGLDSLPAFLERFWFAKREVRS